MEKFAGYGFNKSHAAAYALLAYQTAWLKAHYHGRVLRRQHVDRDGRHRQGARRCIDDAQGASASTILPPDVNACELPLRAGGRARPIRYGLGAIKGTGQRRDRGDRRGARGGRARSRACSTSARASTAAASTAASVEALIKAGAFDAHAARRARRCSRAIDLALDWAETQAAHADQGGLFDLFGDGDSHGASSAGAAAGRGARPGASRSG